VFHSLFLGEIGVHIFFLNIFAPVLFTLLRQSCRVTPSSFSPRFFFLSPIAYAQPFGAFILSTSASIFISPVLRTFPSFRLTPRRCPRSPSVQPPHLPLPASISLPLATFALAFLLYISSYSYLLPLSPHPIGVNGMLTIHPERSSKHSPPQVSASPSPPTALCTKPRSSPSRTSLHPLSRPVKVYVFRQTFPTMYMAITHKAFIPLPKYQFHSSSTFQVSQLRTTPIALMPRSCDKVYDHRCSFLQSTIEGSVRL
jgi:hypothetical protein